MSSRFNRPRWPWGTPPVCRAAYAADQPEHTLLIERTLSGFVYYDHLQPSGSPPVSDNPCFRPEPADNSWEADTKADGYELSTVLHQDPVSLAFEITIYVIIFGVPIYSDHWGDIPIRSLDPFDTGLLRSEEQFPTHKVQVRIMM